MAFCTNVIAQEQQEKKKKNRFSVEEFQACQKDFIIKHAKLTPEEAEKFFPLFFELQKEIWLIDKEARKKAGFKRGEKRSEEQCAIMINEIADAKIKKAELEKKIHGIVSASASCMQNTKRSACREQISKIYAQRYVGA